MTTGSVRAVPGLYRDAGVEPLSASLLVGFADHVYMVVDKIYLVAGLDFFTLAGLDCAVDTDQPVGNCLFGIAAALAKPFEFENLEKLDKFGFQFRDDII
jgi:hypothetical protein